MLALVRIIHSLFAFLLMGCLGIVYYFGITGQRSPLILPAVIMLILEGLFLWRNKGLCPLEPLHRKLGDDKGFFGLFLPPGWLPHVIPFFTVITSIGFLLLLRTA
jgi:hypothetical protein